MMWSAKKPGRMLRANTPARRCQPVPVPRGDVVDRGNGMARHRWNIEEHRLTEKHCDPMISIGIPWTGTACTAFMRCCAWGNLLAVLAFRPSGLWLTSLKTRSKAPSGGSRSRLREIASIGLSWRQLALGSITPAQSAGPEGRRLVRHRSPKREASRSHRYAMPSMDRSAHPRVVPAQTRLGSQETDNT